MERDPSDRIRGIVQSNWQTIDLAETELPLPKPKPNSEEHLIKVHATAPCSGELLWVRDYPAILGPDKTLGVPCYDLAGVVVSAPKNSPFPPGSEIYTRTDASRDGNAREYTIAMTSELALKPKSLTMEEAASVPLSAFTAYQGLFVHGGLEPAFDDEAGKARNAKKRLLVTAASGSVGVWVVQLARAAGVGTIVGVCSGPKASMVKELGATEVIDYRTQSIDNWVAAGNDKFDLAFNAVGGKILTSAWKAVKRGGIFLSITGFSPETDKPNGVEEGVRASFFIMEPNGWQLNAVTKLLDHGKARPVVDSVWGFEDFQKAFDKVGQGRSKGKVVIKVA